jgi:regulator of protease activity HflC (stomatin/prohibitin superfamily)
MVSQSVDPGTPEKNSEAFSGWPVLLLNAVLFIGAIVLIIFSAIALDTSSDAHTSVTPGVTGLIVGVLTELIAVLLVPGYFTLQPNEARVLILFGAYKGTVRKSGFHWANPFYARSRGSQPPKEQSPSDGPQRNKPMALRLAQGFAGNRSLTSKLSLRAHNFSSQTLKVNDKRGNPVEIAAVVVWRVGNTAQAVFDVEDYGGYVEIQSESAIRSIASCYVYDHGAENELTLRGGADEVALALKEELQLRLAKAGVIVEEARLTHLAYAPEIAPAMLRRQQAEAVVAARQIIVQNAVNMVQLALTELDQKDVVKLDDERKAAMVSNLLVVLCGNSEATPVINTGTLYT